MGRLLSVGTALVVSLVFGAVPDAGAQTKDDTIVYALQSDVDTWDPPNSVLREAIILGYQVFDHLAVRDLKTRKVGPNLAVSWKNIDDTTWEVKLRQGVKFHDGTDWSAEVAKFNLERMNDSKSQARAFVTGITSVRSLGVPLTSK